MKQPMNSKLFLMAVAVVAAFGIAAVAGVGDSLTIATPAVAQNMTGDNATMMAGNMTAGNSTGGNWTLTP
jgi:predicted outer membrane protein